MRFNDYIIQLISLEIYKWSFSIAILETEIGYSLFHLYISRNMFVIGLFWKEFCLWEKR